MKVTKQDQIKIEKIRTAYSLSRKPGFNSYNWKGTIVKNIKAKKIGWIIEDINGFYRSLIVKYPDNTKDEIILANIGPNPEEVKKYKYFWEEKLEWSSFGW